MNLRRPNSVTHQIPDNLPDYSQPVYTPSDQQEYYDEPDPLGEIPTVDELFGDALRPSMSRSEAEEQMHLAELRRQAEGYNQNDAAVISLVLAKNHPMEMFSALNDEYFNMKGMVDTITGAVKSNEQ